VPKGEVAGINILTRSLVNSYVLSDKDGINQVRASHVLPSVDSGGGSWMMGDIPCRGL